MEEMLSKEIQAGLDAARVQSMRRASRLRVDVDGMVYPVLKMWKTGFSVAAETAPHLRGLVDLYDGSIHLFRCLIVASDEDVPGQKCYEFKRATPVATCAALDFEKSENTPARYIADRR